MKYQLYEVSSGTLLMEVYTKEENGSCKGCSNKGTVVSITISRKHYDPGQPPGHSRLCPSCFGEWVSDSQNDPQLRLEISY